MPDPVSKNFFEAEKVVVAGALGEGSRLATLRRGNLGAPVLHPESAGS